MKPQSSEISLFNEGGLPNYALPRYLLSLVEVLKIPLSGLGVFKLKQKRLKKAIYDFLMSYCSMDDDIVDFMVLTFARSHTQVSAVMRPGFISQEKKMSIVN